MRDIKSDIERETVREEAHHLCTTRSRRLLLPPTPSQSQNQQGLLSTTASSDFRTLFWQTLLGVTLAKRSSGYSPLPPNIKAQHKAASSEKLRGKFSKL